jgi:hypothetical protein
VGDVANDISVDAGNVSTLAAFVSHLPTPQIPPIPTGITITPLGADPTLSLGDPVRGGDPSRARVISVPILLDDPHPLGSTGMTETVLALTYDPSALSLSAADVTLGSLPGLRQGWQVAAEVNEATGQIGITLYSTTPLATSQAGSLVDIGFHVAPGTLAPATSVRLVPSTVLGGRQFTTQVDDTQGQLVLSPGIDQRTVQTGATPLTLAASVSGPGESPLAHHFIAEPILAAHIVEEPEADPVRLAVDTGTFLISNNDLTGEMALPSVAGDAYQGRFMALPLTVTPAFQADDPPRFGSPPTGSNGEQDIRERLLLSLAQVRQATANNNSPNEFAPDFLYGWDLDRFTTPVDHGAGTLDQESGQAVAAERAVDRLFAKWADDLDVGGLFGDL